MQRICVAHRSDGAPDSRFVGPQCRHPTGAKGRLSRHQSPTLCRQDDEPIWTYLSWERPRDRDQLATIVEQAAADPDRVTYAIVPVETDRAAGFCSLMRIDEEMGSIEVGAIRFYAD